MTSLCLQLHYSCTLRVWRRELRRCITSGNYHVKPQSRQARLWLDMIGLVSANLPSNCRPTYKSNVAAEVEGCFFEVHYNNASEQLVEAGDERRGWHSRLLPQHTLQLLFLLLLARYLRLHLSTPANMNYCNTVTVTVTTWFLPWRNCLPSRRPLWTDTHPTNVISQWRHEWKSALVVNSSLVDDPSIWQLGIDLPRCYWALLNHFWTNQGHCASCRKKWGLAATEMCPCGKCRTMSHIVNSCPQSKLEGAAAIALSWWHCYWMVEDIRLDNNNSCHYTAWEHNQTSTQSPTTSAIITSNTTRPCMCGMSLQTTV